MPAIGCQPSLWKIRAASGGSTIGPASPAMLPSRPMSAIAGMIRPLGALVMDCVRPTSNQPDRSATPMPSMMMSTCPSGAKAPKVLAASPMTTRMPSVLSRLVATRVSPVPGWTALHPLRPATADAARVRAQRPGR